MGCVVGQRWGDGVSDVPEWDGGCDDVVVVVGVQWVGVWDDVYVGCGGVRCGGESVAAEFDLGVDECVSGRGCSVGSVGVGREQRDGDLDHAGLDGLDGQHRCDRVQRVSGSTAQGDSTVTTYTFTGLACGTSYLLAVEAF